jgi:hypothetical protein
MIRPWRLRLNTNTMEYEYKYDMDIIQYTTGIFKYKDTANSMFELGHYGPSTHHSPGLGRSGSGFCIAEYDTDMNTIRNFCIHYSYHILASTIPDGSLIHAAGRRTFGFGQRI